MPSRTLVMCIGTAMVGLSCAGDQTPTDIQEAGLSELVIIAGDQQSDTVGNVLTQDLIVKVLTTSDDGAPAVTVTWQVLAGGGAIEPVLPVTDATGRVIARWSLGTVPGANRVRAEVAGLPVVEFTAEAVPGAPSSVVISPADAIHFAAAGDTAQLQATVFDQYGNALNAAVTWSTTNDEVADVDNGVVTAVDDGAAFVTARIGEIADSVSVGVSRLATALILTADRTTVNALYDTIQLAITITDANGAPLPQAPVAWDVLGDPSVLALDEMVSRAVAVGVGEVFISARSGAASDSVHVLVRQIAAEVSVEVDSVYLASMDTMRVWATAADSNGFGIENRTFTWTSSDTSAVLVNENGRVTAVEVLGSSVVRASMDDATSAIEIVARTPFVYSVYGVHLMNTDGTGSVFIGEYGTGSVGWASRSLIRYTGRAGQFAPVLWEAAADGSSPYPESLGCGPIYAMDLSSNGLKAIYSEQGDIYTCEHFGTWWEVHGPFRPGTYAIWSPDGQRTATVVPVDGWPGRLDIDDVAIFHDPSAVLGIYALGWSPDGSRLVMTVDTDSAYSPYRLYTVSVDGTDLREILPEVVRPGSDGLSCQNFTPDGKRIACLRTTRTISQTTVMELVLLNWDGTIWRTIPLQELTGGSPVAGDVAFRPGMLRPTAP